MKSEKFYRLNSSPELAISLLNDDINEFIDDEDNVVSISHDVIEIKEDNGTLFLASAIICYK